MSGLAKSSAALPALTLPPYWMRMASPVASSYSSLMQARMAPQTSSAWSLVAVLPVPLAQMGS